MTPTRRAVLLGGVTAGVAAAAGCTGQPPPRPEPVDPDVALRAAAVERETRLLAAYDALAAAAPALAERLRPLRADHEEHVRALHASAGAPTPASPPGSPRATPMPSLDPGVRTVAGLVQAERAAAAAHAQATAGASRSLAALLASLAASEASHPVALT